MSCETPDWNSSIQKISAGDGLNIYEPPYGFVQLGIKEAAQINIALHT